jgi:hypothetical protein
MPLQNRVDPFSEIHAVPQRGAWMGNRGILHDEARRVRRFQATRRWIICELEYKGIRRPVMEPSRYTELFFLDEATGFAAGHRPCHFCRRDAAREFLRLAGAPSLAELDKQLHQERMGSRLLDGDWRELPNGAMIGSMGRAYLVFDAALHRWSFEGYRLVDSDEHLTDVRLLTPPTTVGVLRAGYSVQIGLGH